MLWNKPQLFEDIDNKLRKLFALLKNISWFSLESGSQWLSVGGLQSRLCNVLCVAPSISLCSSWQSVWTTRLHMSCPSPATASRDVLLPLATRPLGTPAFQEPGSTSAWSILVVGVCLLLHAHNTITTLVINTFHNRSRVTWKSGWLRSQMFLFLPYSLCESSFCAHL